MIKPSNNLSHTSTWVFTLTANSAGVYMQLCAPGPRNVSTYFGVSTNILLLFYRATIEIVIRSGITSFYGNLSVHSKITIPAHREHFFKNSRPYSLSPSLQKVFEQTLVRQAQKICSDATEVLHSECQLLPSGKRYRIPKCKLSRYIGTLSLHSRSKN